MKQKIFNNVRFQLKGDSEENLQKASGFVPLDKELVMIKPDDNNQYARLMVGDGVTNVGDLSVINPQSDWNQDDPTQPDYIKNRALCIKTTYADLVALRDAKKLVPGAFYRITDYQCTTVQECTRAANNQFDIIVQALSKGAISETASADYHYDKEGNFDGYFQYGIETQICTAAIHYTTTDRRYDETYSFNHFGYEANADGITVPVLYIEVPEEDILPDKCFYLGTYNLGGEIYDYWRIVEEQDPNHPSHTWDNDTKKFMLTNIVINNEQFIITDASEVEMMYKIFDDSTSVYGVASIQDVIAELTYGTNYDGVEVPVLYKTKPSVSSEPDYDDPMFYVGRYEYGGKTYDRWRKIELTEADWEDAWADPYRHYVLTDIMVEDNHFIDGLIQTTVDVICQANIPAWQIQYSLDNDTTKFAWADEVNGKGVIYYMKDEWNNECYYDFKNIQFIRPISLKMGYPLYDAENGVDTWVYTFCGNSYNIKDNVWSDLKDGSLESPHCHMDDEGGSTFRDNVIKSHIMLYDGIEESLRCGKRYLNNNVFLGYWEEVNRQNPSSTNFYYARCCYNNTLNADSYNNTFGAECTHNSFGTKCFGNVFTRRCKHNTFGNEFSNNTINSYMVNSIFDNFCYSNTFNGEVYDSKFGCYFRLNTFNTSCGDNIFDANCANNQFQNVTKSVFAHNVQSVTASCQLAYVTIECNCQYLNIKTSNGLSCNYLTVGKNIKGTNAQPLILSIAGGSEYEVIYQRAGAYEIIIDM